MVTPAKHLTDLHPEWLPFANNPRWGTGVAFDCPTHGVPCRVHVYFHNAVDGGDHETIGGPNRERLYTQKHGSLSGLSIVEKVVIPGHWTGRIDHGDLLTES